jgi:hypothetical protein
MIRPLAYFVGLYGMAIIAIEVLAR